jgi:hypothetical protein
MRTFARPHTLHTPERSTTEKDVPRPSVHAPRPSDLRAKSHRKGSTTPVRTRTAPVRPPSEVPPKRKHHARPYPHSARPTSERSPTEKDVQRPSVPAPRPSVPAPRPSEHTHHEQSEKEPSTPASTSPPTNMSRKKQSHCTCS